MWFVSPRKQMQLQVWSEFGCAPYRLEAKSAFATFRSPLMRWASRCILSAHMNAHHIHPFWAGAGAGAGASAEDGRMPRERIERPPGGEPARKRSRDAKFAKF